MIWWCHAKCLKRYPDINSHVISFPRVLRGVAASIPTCMLTLIHSDSNEIKAIVTSFSANSIKGSHNHYKQLKVVNSNTFNNNHRCICSQWLCHHLLEIKHQYTCNKSMLHHSTNRYAITFLHHLNICHLTLIDTQKLAFIHNTDNKWCTQLLIIQGIYILVSNATTNNSINKS